MRGALTDEGLVCLECLITLAEAGAAVHAVCECPSSGSVAAQVECLARCLHPLRLVGLDQSTREQGAEMGDVAVSFLTDVTVVIFLAVFFDLAAGTDEDRIELGDLLTDGIEEGSLLAQFISQKKRIGIAFPDKTLIEGATSGNIIFSLNVAGHSLDLLSICRLFRGGGWLDE